jgi:hypothetical protein
VATIEVICTQPKQYLITTNTQTTTTTAKRLTRYFHDITNFPLQWLIMTGLVTIWVLIIYLVPFEGCPAGYLGPGKYQMMILIVKMSTLSCRRIA